MNTENLKERFKTQIQRERELRNIEMVNFFMDEVKSNPTEKKTHIISKCAEKYKLTYSATRLILIKVGVYKSKR